VKFIRQFLSGVRWFESDADDVVSRAPPAPSALCILAALRLVSHTLGPRICGACAVMVEEMAIDSELRLLDFR
jgi:hypothetical protein